MRVRFMWNRTLSLAICSFLLALAGSFLGDGTTKVAFAQLTTADCQSCHNAAFWLPYTGGTNCSVDQKNPCNAAEPAHHALIYALGGTCGICHNVVDYSEAVNNCTGCHGTTGHQASHDKTIVPSQDCLTAGCHTSPNVYTEHLGRPKFTKTDGTFNCAVCHASTDPNVQAAIAAGRGPNGTPQECGMCHANAGQHEAAHDMTRTDSPSCVAAGCHYSQNVFTEHVIKRGWTCGACHGTTNAAYTDAIAKGMGTAPYTQPGEVFCTDCHGTSVLSHEAVHDHTFLPTVTGQDCTKCHAANVVTEHVVKRSLPCSTCHNSTRPEVLLAIEDGRTKAGGVQSMDIYCIRCHEQSGQGQGHALVTGKPWSECVLCHYIEYNSNPLLTIHDEHVTYAKDINEGCAVCHPPAPAAANCAKCHSLDSTKWVLPRGSVSLNIMGPTTEDHDKHTALILCTTCHGVNVPGGTPIPAPYNTCSSCHPVLKYGQAGHTTHITAANKDCTVCHNAAATCNGCHAAGHPPIPAPFDTCKGCHKDLSPSTSTTTPTIHDQHRAEAVKRGFDCTVCHTAAPTCNQCHSPGHPPIPAPFDKCKSCHTTLGWGATTHVTHLAAANNDCALCHTAAPNCYACHPQNRHHTTTQAQSGECTYCHADPRLPIDPNAPVGQLACRQCHIDSNNFVKTSAGKPSHAFNTAGAIKDFGACFSCHRPTPYHAKPTVRPRDCFATTATAPGKGSFNLFSSQFGGGSEHNERNENCDDKKSSYTRPAISFNMVTITDTLNTAKQWSVPTFGTGSGDTVTITKAEWSSYYHRIQVYATNTLTNTASLSMKYGGNTYTMTWNSTYKRWEKTISSISYYSTVTVTSNKGGSATATVVKK